VGLHKEYASLNSLFDPFLFSSIVDQENGMEFTILSALARLGIDPWEEAARLAALPKPMASEALVVLIGRLPKGNWKLSHSAELASRLVELLPCPKPPGARQARAEGITPAVRSAIWFGLIVLGIWVLYFVGR
jgi:hypothetical protein